MSISSVVPRPALAGDAQANRRGHRRAPQPEVATGRHTLALTISPSPLPLPRHRFHSAHHNQRGQGPPGHFWQGLPAKGSHHHQRNAVAIIDNIEVAQVTVSSLDGGNGAAIRHQGLNLYVRNCYFHDGDEGILTNSMGLAPGKNGAAVG
jgi:hypothetical protein